MTNTNSKTLIGVPATDAVSARFISRGDLCLDPDRSALRERYIETRNRKPVLGPVKKDQRKVKIPLDPTNLLKQEKKCYAANKLRFGEAFDDTGYVWSRKNGTSA